MGHGRAPADCWRAGGRWDDGSLDVLYASTNRDGAIAERRFHLFRGQPLPPSKIRYALFELRVRLAAMIVFPDLKALQAVGMNTGMDTGMNMAGYGLASHAGRRMAYKRSQEVAEAYFFLGADGILVPNPRHPSQNLIVFREQDTEIEIETVRNHGLLDWR
ncbi:MAG: RES family NAD+ phosphorylase [Proteobacteria bacterium]|nr:RES family NAD+ phosphorylase [Pseudomonadota bacterium]MDA1323763.1 RES family NAD+ phosphorylase [Pseudomonadota bacterium]